MIKWYRFVQSKVIFPWLPNEEYKCLRNVKIQVDPYWEDIIDETNRRLNNDRNN